MKKRLISSAIIAIGVTVLPVMGLAAPEKGMKSSSPIHITADTLIVSQDNKTATFSGNVDAAQDNLTLRSEKMVVYYLEGKGENNSISKIEVFGNVMLSRPGETAKGDKGVYDVTKDTIHLSGNVMLSKDNNMVQGTNLVYNLKTGKSQITGGGVTKGTSGGRVKGVFIPQQDKK
jgi:lipopolysaccharide export system protein LptA